MSKPEMTPDAEEAEACMTCHSQFSITRRRHHCRKCGKVVCSSCGNYTMPLTAFDPVRVCIECWTDVNAKKRGLSRQSMVEFISTAMKSVTTTGAGGGLSAHKLQLIKQLTELTELKDKHEKKMLSGEVGSGAPDHTPPIPERTKTPPAGGAATSNGAANGAAANTNSTNSATSTAGAPNAAAAAGAAALHDPSAPSPTGAAISAAVRAEVDMIEQQRAYTELAKRHTAIADELTDLRLKHGMVATVVFPGESATINFWSHRYLVVSPAPNSHIGLTGFIYPHPSMANIQSTREIGFQFIRNTEELTSVRACSFTYKNSVGADVALTGVSLGWLPPSEVVTTAPMGAGGVAGMPQKPVTGNAAGKNAKAAADAKAAAAGKVEPPPRLRFIVIENESDNNDLVGEHSSAFRTKAVNRGVCDELVNTLHAHMNFAMDRVRQQKKIVDVYCKYMRTEVTWSNPEHEALLQRLWRGFAGPAREFPGHKHEAWKSIGFQGSDPVTDFRGMGYLGLQCLVYMGETHPEECAKLMTPERNYPVCCAGINLVFVLADLLQLSNRGVNLLDVPLFKLSCRGASDRMRYFIQELMSCLLPYLDKLFVEAKAGYMDFPTHFGALKSKLLAASSKDPDSIETLIDYTRGTEEQTDKREREIREARERAQKAENEKKAAERKAAAAKLAAAATNALVPGAKPTPATPTPPVGTATPAGAKPNGNRLSAPAGNGSTKPLNSLPTPLSMGGSGGSGGADTDTDSTPHSSTSQALTAGLRAHDNWAAMDDQNDTADDEAATKLRQSTVVDDEAAATAAASGDIKSPPTGTTAAAVIKKSASNERVAPATPVPAATPAPAVTPAPTRGAAITASPLPPATAANASVMRSPASTPIVVSARPPPVSAVIIRKAVVVPKAKAKAKPKSSSFGDSLFGGKPDT